MKMYDKITKVIHWFVFLLFAFLTTIVLLQILCRMLHIPQTWIDEISQLICNVPSIIDKKYLDK